MEEDRRGSMNWTYQVMVAGSGGQWSSVNVVFATQAEAEAAGLEKYSAWSMCTDYRVVATAKPANYRMVEGRMEFIKEEK